MDIIIEQLKTIIAERLDTNIKREEITPDVSLLEDGLGLDSIMVVELVSAIEEHFGFEFGEDELDLKILADLRTLATFVASKQTVQAVQAG
jgi:acyl carrier protein